MAPITHLVIEVQLRAHEDEAKHVHRPDQAAEDPAVPRLVLVVDERVDGITDDQWVQDVAEVHGGLLVVLLGLGLGVRGPGQLDVRHQPE